MRLLLIAILTLGFTARVTTVRAPLFDFHSWRQADTASIARNFLEERFNPLYPQVDWRGARPDGYVETGLELHALGVAAASKLVGFSPAVGRLLSAVLFPAAALLLFGFVRRRYGDDTALAAAFIYSVGLPLTMFMDRAFMNESVLAFLSIGCLYAAQSYCLRGQWRDLLLLTAASVLIAIVKPTYLVVWGPLFGLFIERFGKAAAVKWELWLAGLITCAAAALWFWHARNLYELTGLTFGLENKFFDARMLLSLEYPFKIARRLVKDVLGPATAVFAVVGLAAVWKQGKLAEAFGVVAFAVYLVAVTVGNFHHNYYQLPIAPIGAVLAGVGILAAATRIAERKAWAPSRRTAAVFAVLWVIVMSTVVRNVSAHNWYELNRTRLRLCDDLTPLLAPADRVVFVNDQSPDVLFCVDRKGWLLNSEQSTLAYVRHLKDGGASIVVLQRGDGLIGELGAIGARILETPDYIAFRVAPALLGAR